MATEAPRGGTPNCLRQSEMSLRPGPVPRSRDVAVARVDEMLDLVTDRGRAPLRAGLWHRHTVLNPTEWEQIPEKVTKYVQC